VGRFALTPGLNAARHDRGASPRSISGDGMGRDGASHEPGVPQDRWPVAGSRALGDCARVGISRADTETQRVITEYVLFDLPVGISRHDVVAGMHEVAPRWQREPNLIRKTFVLDERANQAGAFYLWKDRASAEAAHDHAWRQRIRSKYGSEPQIRYFDTPLVVDNALGQLIE